MEKPDKRRRETVEHIPVDEPRDPESLTEAEIAWLAGLLEGEGTFGGVSGYLNPSQRQQCHIEVHMVDRDVILRAAALMGSHYVSVMTSNKPNLQTQFRAKIGGAEARRMMHLLQPHMGERRAARIEDVLQSFESPIVTVCSECETEYQAHRSGPRISTVCSPECKLARRRRWWREGAKRHADKIRVAS